MKNPLRVYGTYCVQKNALYKDRDRHAPLVLQALRPLLPLSAHIPHPTQRVLRREKLPLFCSCVGGRTVEIGLHYIPVNGPPPFLQKRLLPSDAPVP